LLIIIALLVIIPIVELAVLISVGHVIGVWPTVLLVLATSVLGGWLLRHEGGRSWRAFRDDLQAGRPPGNAATDGLVVLVGGMLMLIPGFVSDVAGLVLIFPPTRRLARVGVLRVLIPRLGPTTVSSLFGARTVRARTGAPQAPGSWSGTTAPGQQTPGAGQGETIEGEIVDGDIVDR
jgi:UPF0716 protein FxsA